MAYQATVLRRKDEGRDDDATRCVGSTALFAGETSVETRAEFRDPATRAPDVCQQPTVSALENPHAGIGRVVDNKYEIIAFIGRGGMSNVWLGRDRRLEKLWAIKEIKSNVAGRQGEANRQAIIDEANFMKRLDHPAIPRVVDIIDTGSSIFVVMDYINGRPLNRVLREQGGPFSQGEVIGWGIQLCDVLGYLHGIHPPDGYPVVYRDMKPSNVMLRDDGSVKVIDFGISMELLPSGPSDTRVIGTGGYGAPEQVDKELHRQVPVDTRADIYALGATLYSLVTGHVPRSRKGKAGVTAVDFHMRPIRAWNPKLSDGLEHIILRATQHAPEDRYQTVDEMRYDLEHFEELTQEYRAAQQAKVDGFWRRVRAAGIALAIGIACLIASSLLRNSSYDTLVHEASVAATDERNVQVSAGSQKRMADASEAEDLLTRAIDLAPEHIEPYQQLLSVYQTDNVFTPSESERWLKLWQRHGRELEGNERYARLCYDIGNLYLCFYDYQGTKDQADASGVVRLATGQGSIQNAARSTEWFRRAKGACDQCPGFYVGKEESGKLTEAEYNALSVFETIGSFYDTFTTNSVQGKDVSGDAATFFDSLRAAIVGPSRPGGVPTIVDGAEHMFQLRLYQVAFESMRSPTYLGAMMRGGVGEGQAKELLEEIHRRVTASDFVSWAQATAEVTAPMYQEIMDGYQDALNNIHRTYHSPAVERASSTVDGEMT